MDTCKLITNSTKINAFKTDSIYNDSIILEPIVDAKCDIVIQNECRFDNINNPNVLNNLDMSIIISIIIFFLGFVITEGIRRRNKSNELNQYKQFIEEWIKKSNPTLSKYIESLEVFSDEIKNNTDFNIAKWNTVIIHLAKLNDIPFEKYSDIYLFGLSNNIDSENRKQLMNFLYQLEYINKCPSSIMDVYNHYCEKSEKIMNEWNLHYMQLIDLFQMYNNINTDTFDGRIVNKIMNMFIPLLSKANNGAIIATDEWSEVFINPAMKVLSNDECVNYPILLEIIKHIKSLNIVIIKHNNINKYYKVFDSYINSLKIAQDIINESMQYFSSKKIKRYCK